MYECVSCVAMAMLHCPSYCLSKTIIRDEKSPLRRQKGSHWLCFNTKATYLVLLRCWIRVWHRAVFNKDTIAAAVALSEALNKVFANREGGIG